MTNVDGTVDYTPNTGSTGQDTFTYTVDDKQGETLRQALLLTTT